jgi:hypothetical protein
MNRRRGSERTMDRNELDLWRSAVNRLIAFATSRRWLAAALTVIAAIVVAGCKNGGGSGY